MLVLRLAGLGLVFAHGWPKLARFLAGEGAGFIAGVERLGFPLPAVFAWAAVASEVVGGFAITLGLFTRIAALFAGFTVFVAAFVRHRLIQQVLIFFGVATAPEDVVRSWGNPERAALYVLIFASLVFTGGGRLSLDHLLRRKN